MFFSTSAPTMPLSLEDGSKGARADPLTQSDLTLGDLPVVTGVSSAQSFLSDRTHSQCTRTRTNTQILYGPTILLRSSDEDDDLRSLCWHGDFCGTLTLVREPGKEAGGVADSPVVDPDTVRRGEKTRGGQRREVRWKEGITEER